MKSGDHEDELLALIQGAESLDSPAAAAVLARAGMSAAEVKELRRVRRELADVAAFERDVMEEALRGHGQADRGPRFPRLRTWTVLAAAVVLVTPLVVHLSGRRPPVEEPPRATMGGELEAVAPVGTVPALGEFEYDLPTDLRDGDRVTLVITDLDRGTEVELEVDRTSRRYRPKPEEVQGLGPRLEWRVEWAPRDGGPVRKSYPKVVTLESPR